MDFIARVRTTYDWLSMADATRIVDKAKMFYYSLRYPCDLSVDEETCPLKGFRVEQWILAACDEIVERLGFNSAVGYRENGVTWSFDNAQLSKALIDMVTPVATVIGG